MAREHIEYLAFHIWHTVLCMLYARSRARTRLNVTLRYVYAHASWWGVVY